MVTLPPEECPRGVPQAGAPQTPQLGGVGPRWLSIWPCAGLQPAGYRGRGGHGPVQRCCMNLGIPHSAEFLGVHFKKRHKVLKHSLQRGSANGAAEDRGWFSAPGQSRDRGARSTFSVCLSLRLPPPG